MLLSAFANKTVSVRSLPASILIKLINSKAERVIRIFTDLWHNPICFKGSVDRSIQLYRFTIP